MRRRPELMRQVRQTIRHPYAWPGGYPVYVVLADGAMLCPTCARAEYRQLSDAAREPEYRTGWEPVAVEVLWEDNDGAERCGHCDRLLQSAYGPDTTEQGAP